MEKLLDTFKMETKFDGLIKLLAEGLYSEPDVFIRELIQNAHDSIIRRKETEPDLAGRIEVTIDPLNQTIVFADNGIGMDEEDIRQFLSVIGSTGTGTERERGTPLSYELIGQFGIGMLSAFVVADKVYVDTLKRQSGRALRWLNAGSETCQLFTSDIITVGSRITVCVRDDFTYFLDESKVRKIIIQYCDFISAPIYVNGIGPVNTVDPPWNKKYLNSEAVNAAYHDFINRRFTDYSLDVFPFEIDGPYRAKGILYISDRHIADVNTGGLLDVFIRRMLVKRADSSLLPPWAKFIRGVIDSPDLKPTAARDNIQSSDKSFEYIRQELGHVIMERIAYLAKVRPDRFRTINEWHHYHLKGMAFFYDEFFNEVADLLLFETNRGMMSLREYLPKNEQLPSGRAPIYFFPYDDSSAQYYRLADAKNVVVINAGKRFDEEVLKKYAKKYDNRVELQQLDLLSDEVLFESLSAEEAVYYSPLEQEFTFALNRSGLNVKVETKRFLPSAIPAVIIETARSEAEENLRALLSDSRIRMGLSDTWDEAIKEQRQKLRKLVINADNSVIARLMSLKDTTVRQRMLICLYNNSMLYSHRMPEESMNAVHDSIVLMMNDVVNLSTEKVELTAKVETMREKSFVREDHAVLPEFIRIFMITPFDNEFKTVEEAVRNVLETAPFFFQVRLARDYTHTGSRLVNDTRQHIAGSHGFIADISGLNPNVMMEMGAILMREDERPMLVLRSDDDTSKVPVDLGDKLRIHYGAQSDPMEEIANAIRRNLVSDSGEVIHEDMKALMQQRRARYLSRILLKQIPGLSDEQINRIMGRYQTVEAFHKATATDLAQVGVKEHQVNYLKGELEGMI